MAEQENNFLSHLAEHYGQKSDHVHLLDEFFAITRLRFPVFIGSFSWNSPTIKTRWLLKRHAIRVEENWLTPPAIARAYLKWKYPSTKRKRVTTAQYDAIIRPRISAPLYTRAGTYRDMVMLDLRAAYWTLVSACGADVDYFPGKWLTVKSDCRDFPFHDNKIARSALVSVGIPTPGLMWDGTKLVNTPARNSLVNIMLYHWVLHVLHGVAQDMKTIGAVYIHTDGYVLPAVHEDAGRAIVESWGLKVGVKGRGDADIIHIGKYCIGHEMTRHYNPHDRRMSFDNLLNVNGQWLRPRVLRAMSAKG